jgi:hypothetical protein
MFPHMHFCSFDSSLRIQGKTQPGFKLTAQALRHLVKALALEEVARLEAQQPCDDEDNLFENETRMLDTFPPLP